MVERAVSLCLILRRCVAALAALSTLASTGCDVVGPDDRLPVGRVAMSELVMGGIKIELSPHGLTPLAAEATFTTRTPASAAVTVMGAEALTRVVPEATTDHAVPILGLYPGVTNEVVLQVRTPGGTYAVDTLRVATDPLPDFLPSITVEVAGHSRMEDGWNLSSLSIAGNGDFISYPIVFDTNGDIRWYMDLSGVGGLVYLMEPLDNGNYVIGHGHSISEYDLLGRLHARWDMAGHIFHHEVIEKPDGNLIVAVNVVGRPTVEDHIVELDRATGAIVREWDLREVLDVYRRTYPAATDGDWFHMNGIWYDESDGGLIVSGRHQSAVVKLSRENELEWILAGHEGWGPAGLNGDGLETAQFLLTAVDASWDPYPETVQSGRESHPDFGWSWGQHAPLILPNGNLFLFDNGDGRNYVHTGDLFSRGVEYEVDASAMKVRQVWEYGAERGPEFFSRIISDVDYLPGTGNRLIMPGIIGGQPQYARVTEVTYPDGEVVFDARIDFAGVNATGGMGWGEFDLVYRSERVVLGETPSS